MVKRVSDREPGFNCGPGGRDCQHGVKGDHGISGGRWRYGVVSEDGLHGVSLSVLAVDYPPEVDRTRFTERMRHPMGEAVCFHHAAEDGKPCDLLPGGKCAGDCSYLQAGEFWDAHHVGEQFEQPDSFWIALEARLPDDLGVAVAEGVGALAAEIARGLGCSAEDLAQALATVEEQKRSS